MMSPVALFCYNRLDCLRITVSTLLENSGSEETPLFIFSDSWKSEELRPAVEEVRAYLKTISGFKELVIVEAQQNKGLARSIIEGVSVVLESYNEVIVLEDDLQTSTNFLEYMNQSLVELKDNRSVLSISGYTIPVAVPPGYVFDNYYTQRASSWGWATWRDRWLKVDWAVSDYVEFLNSPELRRRFNAMGSDLCMMLDKQMKGHSNSWAIRWVYHQFKTQTYTSFPIRSKVQNIGFGERATHTGGAQRNRFYTPLDKSTKGRFLLNTRATLNNAFLRQFLKQYSIMTRAFYKVKSLLFS